MTAALGLLALVLAGVIATLGLTALGCYRAMLRAEDAAMLARSDATRAEGRVARLTLERVRAEQRIDGLLADLDEAHERADAAERKLGHDARTESVAIH